MAGFEDRAMNVWAQLLEVLKNSDEYKRNGAMDLGRFIALTINASKHYYAITGAKKSYDEFRKSFSFNSRHAGLTHSIVSVSHRLIEIPVAQGVHQLGYVAKEGEGSLRDNSFQTREYEVSDVMPNGQLRFAIYDAAGNLIDCSDSTLSRGGKPAKCLWCHETSINPPFMESDTVEGYHCKEEFKQIVSGQMLMLSDYRCGLRSDLDFTKRFDHTLMELLYIPFMEPSAMRIAAEWKMPVEQVKSLLRGLPTHKHQEFPFLGELYDRHQVDSLAPYSVLRVPSHAREKSAYEPDLIAW
jgi:hypothetical protein